MEIKKLLVNIGSVINKYKFAFVILLIGLVLLMLPEKKDINDENINNTSARQQWLEQESLAKILQSVDGAGRVQVLLSFASGEETLYQIDEDISESDNKNRKIKTVIVSDAQRNEMGLISQINPPIYQGAIVVCQGADSPTVRLAITNAVSKITGLGTDKICVLKMK